MNSLSSAISSARTSGVDSDHTSINSSIIQPFLSVRDITTFSTSLLCKVRTKPSRVGVPGSTLCANRPGRTNAGATGPLAHKRKVSRFSTRQSPLTMASILLVIQEITNQFAHNLSTKCHPTATYRMNGIAAPGRALVSASLAALRRREQWGEGRGEVLLIN